MNSAMDAAAARSSEERLPSPRPAALARPATTARVVGREAGLIAAAALAYVGIRALTEGRSGIAERNAHDLVRVEEAIGVAWEAWIQSLIIGHESLVAAANWVYIYGHWPVIASVALILFSTRRDRYQLLRNAIFASGAIGFLFFAFLPLAPPRLLELGLVDTVAEQSQAYRALQPPELTNQYAAMPSLHFGWNLLLGIALFATTRRFAVRAFAILMPAAMGFAVVATGNHFILDVFVGALVALAGLAIATGLAAAQPDPADTVHAARAPRRGRRPDAAHDMLLAPRRLAAHDGDRQRRRAELSPSQPTGPAAASKALLASPAKSPVRSRCRPATVTGHSYYQDRPA